MATSNHHGDFCWVELMTGQLDQSLAYYSSVFGWDPKAHPMGDGQDYMMLNVQDDAIAGAFALSTDYLPGAQACWSAYVLVDNVDELVKQVADLGGQVLREPFDVMGMGRMAVIQDPTGATLSVWQTHGDAGPKTIKQQHGYVGWVELATTDTDLARPFYEKLFGWLANTQVMPGGKEYTTFMNGEEAAAGMYQHDEEMAIDTSYWTIYFTVDSFEAAFAKATQLGGTAVYEPKQVPGVGEFAMLKDPEGVAFSMIQFE